jgi:hypothetical protein
MLSVVWSVERLGVKEVPDVVSFGGDALAVCILD